MTRRITQADPRAAYLARKADIDAAVARVLDGGWYILGREVEAFEAEFAAFIGVPHVVGVANGTDAIALALRALGIGPGDAVATVSHTAVATVAAIEMAGAVPVLLDIEEDHFTMDPLELERTIAARGPAAPLRAVVPVHLYGQAADLDALMATARRHGLSVVEDCAQAHGARLGDRRLGSFGDAAAFSMYPTKNLGALGDGGAVALSNPELAATLRGLRQYGWRDRYVSDFVGVNSRLDELQAAILRVRLAALDEDNRRRAAIASIYDDELAGCRALRLPARRPGTTHVFHQYVVRCESTEARDRLQAELRDAGIATNVHYPMPVHRQPAYRDRLECGPGGLLRSELAAAMVLSLPMHAHLEDAAAIAVCAAIRQCLG
jgi:dTDP-4-amino-4,6-dideoxygalactose transaminase